MKTKQIILSSIETPYTLDTYQTFDMDGVEDSEIEYYNSENGTQLGYDDFTFEYDTKGYLKDLADNYEKLMNENILDQIILKVERSSEPRSPKFYNYTTDDCLYSFTVNKENLEKYINENKKSFHTFVEYFVNGGCVMAMSSDDFKITGEKDSENALMYYVKYESAKKYDSHTYLLDQLDSISASEYATFKAHELNN